MIDLMLLFSDEKKKLGESENNVGLVGKIVRVDNV